MMELNKVVTSWPSEGLLEIWASLQMPWSDGGEPVLRANDISSMRPLVLGVKAQMIAANEENAALRARLQEAEAVIRPFASLSGWHESYNGENPIDMNMRAVDFGQTYYFGQLKLSNFRAAAAWLAGKEGE